MYYHTERKEPHRRDELAEKVDAAYRGVEQGQMGRTTLSDRRHPIPLHSDGKTRIGQGSDA
jgi:hypothetical protein